MEKILSKAFTNVTTMLKDRGYTISETGNKFIKGTIPPDGMKYVVYFTNNLFNEKGSLKHLIEYDGDIEIAKKTGIIKFSKKIPENRFKFILINYDEEWQLQKKSALEIAYEANDPDVTNVIYEYFEMRKISINPMTHNLQPKYRIITPDSKEYNDILKDNLTSNKLFDKYSLDDPVVKWLYGRPKDIIEITRKDTITYRTVQDKSINLYIAK